MAQLNSQELFNDIMSTIESYTPSLPKVNKYIEKFITDWNNCDSLYLRLDIIQGILFIADTFSDWPIPRKKMSKMEDDAQLWAIRTQTRYLILAIFTELEYILTNEKDHNELINHYESSNISRGTGNTTLSNNL